MFKTKGHYRILEKLTSTSYCIQNILFYEGLEMPGTSIKESASRLEIIPSNLLLHNNHVDHAVSPFFRLFSKIASFQWVLVGPFDLKM